jgi:hypothetical protein
MWRFHAARLWGLILLAGATLALPGFARADTKAAKSAAAEGAVREALQREIYGLEADRRDLLAAAAASEPELAAARWHQGFVRDGKHGWRYHEAILQSPKLAERLAAYERRRAGADDSPDAQIDLADWCRDHYLPDQERAHLTRVIDLDPDHIQARIRLGFVRQNAGWVSRDEIAAEQSRAAARLAALKKWQPILAEIRADLEHRSPQRRDFALGKLREIVDPEAIPAIEAVFADAADEVVIPALDTLANMTDPEAALALARFAAYQPTQNVRDAAAARLGKRELDSFVPQILASMYSPVVSRFLAVTLPSGRIGYRHAFEREAQQRNELLVLDTEYRRVNLGGSRRESAERAFGEAARTAAALEQRAAAQNEFTNRVNDRLSWVLETATGVDLPAQPEAWWRWWNDRNEVFVPSQKPTALIHQTRQVAIVDRVTSGGTGGGTPVSHDCLAAGTLVWTAKGPLAIEQIRVGDLVLAQHPESGELAYKPVLRTTIRPRSQLIKVEAGGETCQTSGGHLFWVAGEGWVKSRELHSGQILHGANGPVHISSVEPALVAETYNLIVADFSTYFVGYRKVLSHDNTVRAPTRAVVPGLQQD